MNKINHFKIEDELNRLDETIKHAIKICLEDANLFECADDKKIGKEVLSYADCKNIVDYVYLKIKEYFLSEYFIRALECFNTLPYNDKNKKIVANRSFFESVYVDCYLFWKNGYEYDLNLNSAQNHAQIDNVLKNIKKHLVNDMKKISNYTHGDTKDIIALNYMDDIILSHDSLKNFYYWANTEFNQNIFLCGCSPVKYVAFLEQNKQRKVPLFFEFATVVYTDLFFNTTNHLSKADTNINSYRIHQDNNNISKLLQTYNNSLEVVKKIQNKLILNNELIRANAMTHYMNSIFANDFFKSSNSLFLNYICSCVNFKRLYDYSCSIFTSTNNNDINPQKLVINKNIIDITNYIQYLNILEFGVKYNINFTQFDSLLSKKYNGISEMLICDKFYIDRFCTFLYLLYNNISLNEFDISFPNISTSNIGSLIKILNQELYNLNSRKNDIEFLNINSKLYKENSLLFSYLFLYPVRHPKLSIQGKKVKRRYKVKRKVRKKEKA